MSSIIVLCIISLVCSTFGAELKEVFSWKQLEYNWPSSEFKEEALKTEAYIPQNNLAHGISIWKDKLFVTVPRYKPGVASSLNYIKLGSDKSAKLTPYPSWDFNFIKEETNNSLKDDSSIVSAFRSWVDGCDRLWVMDTGVANITGARKAIAKPSLVIFDLKTDKLLRRYFLKDTDIKKSSYLINIVVDVNPDSCDNAFAYMPDLGSFALIVYSFADNSSWRLKHHYFYFDPLAGQYNVGGVEFQWTDGIFGVSLSKVDSDGIKRVFFHALSSTKEFEVPNKVLQNETWATNPQNFNDFKFVGERGENSQASISIFDESTGVLFYTQVKKNGVACWNSKMPLKPEHTALIANNAETLEFPNDLKIVDNTLWILSNKLPKYIYKSLDSNDVNFRIFSVPIENAIKETVCA